MIRVSVLYPNGDDINFNIDYYLDTHIPMAGELIGEALKGANIDYGMASANPEEKAPYIVMAHLLFESVEAFQNAFGPHAEKIMADLPNFTNSIPVIQISEVKI